ncbi:MAG: TetR/AcrR family transcriptional regulator [Mucilaginibacter sp.]|uniref:TetR/AcrR family transcriptional regulator n=1 Tax=Mucilaginibacter sp. TaxID=1882438 RepID=UPI0031B193A3
MKPVVVVDKIMETADRLFYEQGYNLTGINQIIEEANISKPSLYNHFKSKSDLLLAYIDQLYKNWFGGLDAFIKDIHDPMDQLIAFFDYRIVRQISSNYGGCAWNKILSEMPKEEVGILERGAKFKSELKTRIASLVKQLERSKDKLLSDEDFTEIIFSQLESGVLMAYITKSHESLENAKSIIRKLA